MAHTICEHKWVRIVQSPSDSAIWALREYVQSEGVQGICLGVSYLDNTLMGEKSHLAGLDICLHLFCVSMHLVFCIMDVFGERSTVCLIELR